MGGNLAEKNIRVNSTVMLEGHLSPGSHSFSFLESFLLDGLNKRKASLFLRETWHSHQINGKVIRGVLPEKIGWGVRPTSQNPYPIYDQNL